MRNDECTIYFTTKKGKVVQSFRKDKEGWKETSSKGIVRPCTAEQFISHILPPLAFGHAVVKVVPDKKILRRPSVKRLRKIKH
jgi:hypothetical protein